MTLPVLNHDVLLMVPKTMVCLKVFKKIELLLFSYMVSYAEYGKSKNTSQSLADTVVFIQVKCAVICFERRISLPSGKFRGV